MVEAQCPLRPRLRPGVEDAWSSAAELLEKRDAIELDLGRGPAVGGPALGAASMDVPVLAHRRGLDARSARVYAFFTTVGKLPQALGQAKYWWNEMRGVKSRIIEYKVAQSSQP